MYEENGVQFWHGATSTDRELARRKALCGTQGARALGASDNRDETGYSTVSSQVLTFDAMALVVVGRDRAQWA